MDGELYRESMTVMPLTASLACTVLFVALFGFLIYVLIGEDGFEMGSTAGMVLMFSLVLTAAVTAILFFLRIKISVTSDALTVGLFKGRRVPLADIDSVAVEEFRAFRDFLGWGLKVGPKGFGYIAAGTDKGLRINLKTEKSFLVSTKMPFEFESAMKTAMRNIKERPS